jgi:uncharacterized repeat protein (TIGR03803 family)
MSIPLFIRSVLCRRILAGVPAFVFALVLVAGACGPAQAQSTFKLLHGFRGGNDGAYPISGVTLGPNGSVFGVTQEGGPANAGTIFYISPGRTEKVLYSFTGGADGKNPYAQLIAVGGSLYGTTSAGGAYGLGTVFKVSPTGVETVLYNFAGPDGAFPYGALIRDAAGNFYGTTAFGGTYQSGNVFRLDPTGVETSIYSFTGGVDGKYPFGRLARDARGNLYGTTDVGGANSCGSYNCGTVFRVEPSGAETVLYSFGGFPKNDGELPQSDVSEDLEGNIYGTTSSSQSLAELFEINQLGQETILYWLNWDSPGKALIRDTAGSFYGTIASGGDHSYGGVFTLEPNGTYTLLYSFTGTTDGANPYGGVVRDAAGNLYGTTGAKGAAKFGTVFELTFP